MVWLKKWTNFSSKFKNSIKKHVKCKDYNKAEKLETAHIQIEFKCKNVKNNLKFSILKGFRNNFFIDLIF